MGSHKASRGGPHILVTDTCLQNHGPAVTPLQGTQSPSGTMLTQPALDYDAEDKFLIADPVVWPGSVYARLCAPATLEGLAGGRACWPAGQIGNRPTPVNGCPQRMVNSSTPASYSVRLI